MNALVDGLPKIVTADEAYTGLVYVKGRRTTEGFVLLKGGKIKLEISPTLREYVKSLRERYASIIGADGVISDDILLRSPNEAAQFVLGYPINALTAWKTSDGKTLKEIENNEAI